MIFIASGLLGLGLGAWRAKKRGGTGADIAHYAVAHGIAFLLAGVILTLLVDRWLV